MASLADILMGQASPGQPYTLSQVLLQDNPQAYESYLAPYSPSPLDRVRQGLLSIGAPQRTAEGAANLLDFLPGVGDAEGAYQAGREGAAGNVLGAAIIGGATLAGLPSGKATQAGKAIRAYHGSPHDFDRFDMSKIGTGEGAQAYGHGLYFAESEDVARTYKSAGSSRAALMEQRLSPKAEFAASFIENGASDIQIMENMIKKYDNVSFDEIMGAIEEAKKAGAVRGRMYEVNIHADPASFLDWDAPLSAQPGQVRDILAGTGGETGQDAYRRFGARRYALKTPDGNVAAGNDLNAALEMAGGDRSKILAINDPDPALRASVLRDAGIPGIKFLDGNSRTAGDGSRNYVVFDDRLIEILRKYGLAGAFLGGAGATNALMPQQPEEGAY